MKFRNEPVAIAAAVRVVLVALAAYGLKLSGEQIAATVLAVEVVAGLLVRQSVTPNALAEERVLAGFNPTTPMSKDPEPIQEMRAKAVAKASAKAKLKNKFDAVVDASKRNKIPPPENMG